MRRFASILVNLWLFARTAWLMARRFLIFGPDGGAAGLARTFAVILAATWLIAALLGLLQGTRRTGKGDASHGRNAEADRRLRHERVG